ncbi:MAG: hypothetical protein ACFFCS_14265 [Candidatus Hodarchaeota archaeon]
MPQIPFQMNSRSLADIEKNARRISGLFSRYIDQFSKNNMPELANKWKRILMNYKLAIRKAHNVIV